MELPPVLDGKAAAKLLEGFTKRRGKPLRVDASAVQVLGSQCVQVLLAARNAWAADAQVLEFEDPSETFAETLDLLGANLEPAK
jgi:chemotaxis protein CheX